MTTTTARAWVTLVLVLASESLARVPSAPTWAAGVMGLLLAGLAVSWVVGWPREPPRARASLRWALGALPGISIALSLGERAPFVAFAPDLLLFPLSFGALLACVALHPRAPPAIFLVGAVVAGLSLRVIDFAVIPIDPRRADMLPLVVSALDRLFHGRSPYGWYEMPWRLPLTYLPGTWLAFAPALLAGVDPRWTSTAAELALGAALMAPSRARSRDAALFLAAWFVAGPLVASDAMTAMPVQSCAVALAATLVGRRSRGATAATGVGLATTPFMLPLLPLVALAWGRRHGRRAAFEKVAVAVTVAALLVVPWAVWSPRAFLEGTVRWFGDLDGFPRRTWDAGHAWAHVAGLTGVLWSLGFERALRALQAVALVATLGWYRRAGSPTPAAWAGAVLATLLGFILLNVIAWPYHLEPIAVLAAVTIALEDSPPRAGDRVPSAPG